MAIVNTPECEVRTAIWSELSYSKPEWTAPGHTFTVRVVTVDGVRRLEHPPEVEQLINAAAEEIAELLPTYAGNLHYVAGRLRCRLDDAPRAPLSHHHRAMQLAYAAAWNEREYILDGVDLRRGARMRVDEERRIVVHY